VIIGNGGAGTSALKTIREVDQDSQITLISKEKFPAYSPCSLPNLLSGEVCKETIFRFDEDFYARYDASFLKNTKALRVRPRKKIVELEDGSELGFDKLLISAGAKPIVPRGMPGMELNGVHVMGTLDSTLGIIDYLDNDVETAIVIGGGFMGVETACMLKKLGIDVTIVELLPHILSQMLDPDVSKVVEIIMKRFGVNIILGKAVSMIVGKERAEGVIVGRKKMPCDMVVSAIGVLPNLDMVDGSGISAGRGIIVDTAMRTNKKDIYAAGDIVELRERIGGKMGSYAIWPNAVEQGRIAGLNMAGMNAEYEGAEVVNVLDVFGTPVVAMGGTSEILGKCDTMVRDLPHSYRTLLLSEGRIVGLQFVGDIRNAGPLYSFMKEGTDVGAIRDRLLDDTFVHMPEMEHS